MYILAIETTGPYGSVALINENGTVLGHDSTEDAMNHLTGLMPMVSHVLETANVKGEELDAIACDIGPGSFTGIRIGVSTARALCQAWGVKAIPVLGLDSFTAPADESHENICCAIYNARRHQVYGYIEGILPAGPWMIEDIVETLKEKTNRSNTIYIYGDGIDAYEDIIREGLEGSGVNYVLSEKSVRYQDAVQIAVAGLEKAKKGELVNYDELLPEYMRQAEAEQKLKAGELPICKGPKQE